MKRNILTLWSLAFLAAMIGGSSPVTAIGGNNRNHAHVDRIEKSKSRTDTISVPDMQCGTCEKTISGALKKLKGVAAVRADAEANLVVVTFDPRKVTRLRIEQTIARAGYDAGSARATQSARNALPMCCRPGAHD